MAQTMVTRFAIAMTAQRQFLNLPAGYAMIQLQTVAIIPVGIPRRVVIKGV